MSVERGRVLTHQMTSKDKNDKDQKLSSLQPSIMQQQQQQQSTRQPSDLSDSSRPIQGHTAPIGFVLPSFIDTDD